MGWKPAYTFERGIAETIHWYVENQLWWKRIISGEYQKYYQMLYGSREVIKK
jgi:dTDP-glucose 4,6-dehydratase